MKIVHTGKAPTPAGHYAQGWVHGDLLFVSGQLPVDPSTGAKVLDTIEAQTLRVLQNLEAVVEAGGSELSRIIKMTVYVSDIALWDRVDRVYAEFFGSHTPARAVVPTGELHHGFQIEMEAVAVLS